MLKYGVKFRCSADPGTAKLSVASARRLVTFLIMYNKTLDAPFPP